MKKIEFFRHSLDEGDISRVASVLRSVFLTTGDETDKFEEHFSQYINSRHTIGVSSCTAGLHLSLLALGIGKGDEVITSPMSFCATANSILHAGATPVFIDVEEETGNLNADHIEKAVTRKTKAIMPVHLYGQMCDMKIIRSVARKYRLKIIEDAAHAIEAERDGIKVGQFSDAACFSFYATKNITSGEGGAVSTNNASVNSKIRLLRLHGIDKGAADRYTKKFVQYDMPILGWKYNMDNIQAALLIGQLGRIDELWKKRDRNWKLYKDKLMNVKGIDFPSELPDGKHARHLFTIRVSPKRRNTVLSGLQRKGVGVAVNFKPVHLLKYYRKSFGFKKGDFPIAEHIGATTVSLPFYPSLKKTEIEYVVKAVKECL